jgi:predicted RNA binding protein YcfA (HicA-like mRNA interferase family)
VLLFVIEVSPVKRRDLVKKLEAAGYRLNRTGDHAIYENENTAKAILKAAGIE